MNNGKRVAGILMIVFGSLFLFMGILFGSIFGLAGYAIKNESDMVDKDFEELKEDAMVPELYEETYGLLNTIFSGFGFAFVGFFVILGLPLLIGGIVLVKKAKVPHDNGVSQEI